MWGETIYGAYLLGQRIIADAGQGWAVSGSANLSKKK